MQLMIGKRNMDAAIDQKKSNTFLARTELAKALNDQKELRKLLMAELKED
jgi:hypothetical protein